MRLALNLRDPPLSIHLFLSWDWGSDKEEQGTQWLGSELLLHHLVVSGIEQVKDAGLVGAEMLRRGLLK